MCFPGQEQDLVADFEMSVNGSRILHSDNGVIYRHLLNNNQDIPLERTINAFKIAYDSLNDEIYPLRMQATSDPNKAHIKIRFAENGDPELPLPFDNRVAAYAYKPRTDRVGEQYFNDAMLRSDIIDNQSIYMVQVIKHETLHSLGLPHNEKDENCVLYPVYGNKRLKMGERTKLAFDVLYQEEYKKALPSALRSEHFDEIDDEERRNKVLTILQSMQA